MIGQAYMPFGMGIQCEDVKITFLERSNATDESVEGVVARMTFSGRFIVKERPFLDEGRSVDAGFGADFDEYNGPKRSWAWFTSPVDDAMERAFEKFFSAEFAEDGLRMDIEPEIFEKFAESDAWGALEDEEDFN